MNNDHQGQNNPGFGEQANPGFNGQANPGFNGQANPGFNGTGNAASSSGAQADSDPAPGGQNYYYQSPEGQEAATPENSGKDYGATSQTLGIIGLVASFVCGCLPIIGLILGIIAVVYGNRAVKEPGQDKDAATAGRICGIIAIILSALAIIASVIYVVFAVILGFSFLGLPYWLL